MKTRMNTVRSLYLVAAFLAVPSWSIGAEDFTDEQYDAALAHSWLSYGEKNCRGSVDASIMSKLRGTLRRLPDAKLGVLIGLTTSAVAETASRANICSMLSELFGPQGQRLPGAWVGR